MKKIFTHYCSTKMAKATFLIAMAFYFNTNTTAQTLKKADILHAKHIKEVTVAKQSNHKTGNNTLGTEYNKSSLKSLPGKSRNHYYYSPDSTRDHHSNTDYVYNSKGQMLSAISKNAADSTNYERILNGYDAFGNDTIEVKQSWEDSTWATYHGTKTMIAYNNKGQIISKTYLDFYNNVWNQNYKDSTVYDIEGKVSEDFYIESIDSVWTIVSRTLYLYNTGSAISHEARFEEFTNGQWIEYARAINIVWRNFHERRVQSYVYQGYNGGNWVNSHDINITFDDNGGSVFILRAWDNNQWVNDIRTSEIFDNMKYQVGYKHENWLNGAWKVSYAYAFDNKYNINGDLIEQIEKGFDTNTETYYPAYKKEFSDFSYVTSAPKANALEVKLYPNPAADFITLESALTGDATLKVTDLAGRILISQHIEQLANQQVDLTSLKPGIYVLIVDAKDGRFVVKVVKQ